MKKIKIIPLTLFTSLSVIGLVSCSGATVTPPVVEPPKPEVIPPTPILKMVKLIKPLVGSGEGTFYEVDKVEYVDLRESTFPSVPTVKCLEYSIKLKNNEVQKLGTIDKEVIKAYNNWLEVSNEKHNK